MPISTRDLSELPDLQRLEKISQSLALLDAILCPEWEYRYFSFNATWDIALGERMASMRNGSGDEYFLLFTSDGAIMKGFDHQAPMSTWSNQSKNVWPGVLDHVPPTFARFLGEPAFNLEDATFCIWRTPIDSQWNCGPVLFPEGDDPDGSEGLAWALSGDVEAYCEFAKNYHELAVDHVATEEIFKQSQLTVELVLRLNPTREYSDVLKEAAEIGYTVPRVAFG